MEPAASDALPVVDRRRARRQVELGEVLDQLAAAYDEQARLDRKADERAWAQNRKRLTKLETRVVTLNRPRRWRLRDLKTGGIRGANAVGVSLWEGKFTYGHESWPAAWSFASITPSAEASTRELSIGRVMLKSAVPLRRKLEADRWSIEVLAEDLPAALALAAIINVASRLRAATFPVGTYFRGKNDPLAETRGLPPTAPDRLQRRSHSWEATGTGLGRTARTQTLRPRPPAAVDAMFVLS